MTTSTILNKDFDFKAIHIGLMVSDDLWQHDKWTVIINGQSFEYSTGIGNRKANKWGRDKKEFERLMRMQPKQELVNLQNHNNKLQAVSTVKPLNIDDVLYSLVIDSDAKDYTFEDWADNFGYDTDSRKGEQIYHACKKNARKVSTFIDNLEEAAELFQDY